MTASLLATIMTAMVAIMAIGIIYVMIQITAGVFKALWFPALVILGAIVGLAAWTNPELFQEAYALLQLQAADVKSNI